MDPFSSDVVTRPFGNAADLDLDFGQTDRLGLVTMVLAQCGDGNDAAFWWAQPVSRRIAALLRLVALTDQRNEISLSGRCSVAQCGATFEFALSLASLAAAVPDVDPMRIQLDGERVLTMRRPTGTDLRRWRDAQPASPTDAIRLMLDSLVLAGDVRPGDEAAVSTLLADVDPLVDFAVSCRCPECGESSVVSVDLEALALGSLAHRQRALVQEVHQLASHYGWTEAEVLAVPAARRARYLRLIEEHG